MPAVPNRHALVQQRDQRLGGLGQVLGDQVLEPLKVAGAVVEPVVFCIDVVYSLSLFLFLEKRRELTGQLVQPCLHLMHHATVHIHQLLNLEPRTRIRPQLRRARLVRGLFVDFILEDRHVRDRMVQKPVPGHDNRFEDIAQHGLGAVQRERLVVALDGVSRLKGQVKGESAPATLEISPRGDQRVFDASRRRIVKDDDHVAVIQTPQARLELVPVLARAVYHVVAAVPENVAGVKVFTLGQVVERQSLVRGCLLVLDVAAQPLHVDIMAANRFIYHR